MVTYAGGVEGPTAADFVLVKPLGNARAMGWLADFPALEAWLDRVKKLPSYEEACVLLRMARVSGVGVRPQPLRRIAASALDHWCRAGRCHVAARRGGTSEMGKPKVGEERDRRTSRRGGCRAPRGRAFRFFGTDARRKGGPPDPVDGAHGIPRDLVLAPGAVKAINWDNDRLRATWLSRPPLPPQVGFETSRHTLSIPWCGGHTGTGLQAQSLEQGLACSTCVRRLQLGSTRTRWSR